MTSHIIFDVEYYLENNPDLKLVMNKLTPNKRVAAALNHFYSIGKKEKRKHRYFQSLNGMYSHTLEPSKTELFNSVVASHQDVRLRNKHSHYGSGSDFEYNLDNIDYDHEKKSIKKMLESFRKRYKSYISGERDV